MATKHAALSPAGLVPPPAPRYVGVSPHAVMPKETVCRHGRLEATGATMPNGERVVVVRCVDCGASRVDPKE
ncbi:MAG: hypothetical protein M3Q10_19025 [Chloroflexota bacterium]|nr:hypothetical protein [Chloroflexota bacterium]